jgi:[ribosomal protein S18]-alanine N-acetyltransferase
MIPVLMPMNLAHIDEVMQYEQDMFGAEAWTARAYADEVADTRSRHYVAAVDESGGLVGWAGVRVVGDEAEVLTVGVIPAARRQGVAGQLMADLLADAKRRGATAMYLEVRVDNEPARKLYEGDGFVKVGMRRGYYDGGRVDAVVMRRDV